MRIMMFIQEHTLHAKVKINFVPNAKANDSITGYCMIACEQSEH